MYNSHMKRSSAALGLLLAASACQGENYKGCDEDHIIYIDEGIHWIDENSSQIDTQMDLISDTRETNAYALSQVLLDGEVRFVCEEKEDDQDEAYLRIDHSRTVVLYVDDELIQEGVRYALPGRSALYVDYLTSMFRINGSMVHAAAHTILGDHTPEVKEAILAEETPNVPDEILKWEMATDEAIRSSVY